MGAYTSLASGSEQCLVLFDGVCNLCNGAVRFIINRDHKNRFRFASLQSEIGKAYMQQYGLKASDLYSILLIKNNRLYDRSTAVLEIAKCLSGFWPAFYFFIIVPPFIRDAAYRLISKNRYLFFGKKTECMIPTAELKARFIE